MSDHVWPVLAVIPAEFADAIEVAHDPASRELRIGIIHRGEEEASAWLSPASRDALRELLDRAAMPGITGPCAAHPDDCPNGPEPHRFVPPTVPDDVLPCCRQPWEAAVLDAIGAVNAKLITDEVSNG